MTLKLAIVTPIRSAYSETFIKNHIEYLAGDKYVFYDGSIPRKMDGDIVLIERYSKLRRLVIRYLGRKRYNENNYDYQWAFGNALTRNRVQCVLAEYGTTSGYIVSECYRRNIPLIAHFHGYDSSVESVLKDNLSRYQLLFRKAAFIVVVSRAMKKKLLELGAPDSKLVYNVYGPSNEFITIKPNYLSKKVLAVGRFVDKKAPHLTILAFLKVLRKHPEAKLTMVGDGPLLRVCQDMVKHLGISGSVAFTGVRSTEGIIALMREVSLFVQHSLVAENGDSEGTPLSILESMAAGLPIVSTRHAGISDVVEEGKTGFLVNEGDVSGMAESMITLLDDVELAQKMGKAAKARYQNHFTLERHIKVLDDLIKQAIEGS